MAAILWSDVVGVAKDLAGTVVPVPSQNLFIGLAEERVDPDVFGGVDSQTYLLARCYYAAHFGALYTMGKLYVGPVSSMGEGGVSTSFSVMAPGSAIAKTNYGDAFLYLAKMSGACAGFVT